MEVGFKADSWRVTPYKALYQNGGSVHGYPKGDMDNPLGAEVQGTAVAAPAPLLHHPRREGQEAARYQVGESARPGKGLGPRLQARDPGPRPSRPHSPAPDEAHRGDRGLRPPTQAQAPVPETPPPAPRRTQRAAPAQLQGLPPKLLEQVGLERETSRLTTPPNLGENNKAQLCSPAYSWEQDLLLLELGSTLNLKLVTIL